MGLDTLYGPYVNCSATFFNKAQLIKHFDASHQFEDLFLYVIEEEP